MQLTMRTLTETAFYSRLTIKYGIFFLIFLVLARISWQIGFGVYRHFFPEPPPPPTVSFGKLPELLFPSQESLAKFSYTLELPEGALPQTSTVLSIFAMPRPQASLVGLDEARKTAKKLGFSHSEEPLSSTIYRFRKEDVPSYIEINIITGAFSINYDLTGGEESVSNRPPTAQVAAAQVRSFLSPANLFPEDFNEGKTNSLFLKNQDGQLIPALSLSDANFVRTDFTRANFNNLPVTTPNPERGNVWFLVSGSKSSNRQIIAGEYHYFPVDQEKSATYPLKTAQTAFDELNNGQGFVVLPGNNKDRVTIRRAYLAYYDADEPQEFFQPVFVFEGDNGFIAYVPAVTEDYYGK